MKPWKILSSTFPFMNKWFTVRQDTVELPDGKVLDNYYVWIAGDASLVIPITADNKLILVKQYKHGVGKEVIEYPAGMVEKGKTPEETANRELQEETGYVAQSLVSLGTLHQYPTKVVGNIHIFLGTNSTMEHDQHLDDNENITVITATVKEVLAMIKRGEIVASDTVAATLLACQHLQLLQ